MRLSMTAKRPACSVEGCNTPVVLSRRLPDGVTGYFRDVCSKHHGERTAKKHGLKNLVEVCARNAGFDDTGRYKDSIHPARMHLEEFCENVDGRLGFVCTTTIHHPPSLYARRRSYRWQPVEQPKIEYPDFVRVLSSIQDTHE